MFAKTTADLEADWAKEPVCNFPARQSRGRKAGNCRIGREAKEVLQQ